MASFDFMTDDDLRASLETDVEYMEKCLDIGAHKAAQVLAGSILEALLTDFLVGIHYKPKTKPILDMTLAELLAAARSERVVSATTVDLASVVKEYRNLIHPGRVKRLAQQVNANTAQIAKAVVEIVIEEVAQRKASTYGLTAKQIAAKVETDPSSGVIIGDLIRDAPAAELARLLTQTLPDRYLELSSADSFAPNAALPALRRTFHTAMEVAPEHLRRRVMEKYVRVLKEQPEFEVLRFEEAFFRAVDLFLSSQTPTRPPRKHTFSIRCPATSGRDLNPRWLRSERLQPSRSSRPPPKPSRNTRRARSPPNGWNSLNASCAICGYLRLSGSSQSCRERLSHGSSDPAPKSG